MSLEFQKYIFIFLCILLIGILGGFLLKKLLSCKGVKHRGKCYPIITQDALSEVLGNINNIKDGKMNTAADVPSTSAATVMLKVNGASNTTMKKVKGARITAMAKSATGTNLPKKTIKLANGTSETSPSKTFDFNQDGKTSSVVQMFDTEQNVGDDGLLLIIPTDVTLYEVELI